jgi:uncharacterized protein YkwD
MIRQMYRWSGLVCLQLLVSVSLFAQSAFPEWTPQQLAMANTAKDANYLSEEEKNVVLLSNLARLDGALFAQTYLQGYVKGKLKGKESRYVRSLSAELQQVKGLPMLKPHEKLFKAAHYHANDMGKKGLIGHKSSNGVDFFARIRSFMNPIGDFSFAENCAYGFSSANDIVLQLLIDEGVPALGHRKNLLSDKFDLVGVSILPHKNYRHNCVQDFGFISE